MGVVCMLYYTFIIKLHVLNTFARNLQILFSLDFCLQSFPSGQYCSDRYLETSSELSQRHCTIAHLNSFLQVPQAFRDLVQLYLYEHS